MSQNTDNNPIFAYRFDEKLIQSAADRADQLIKYIQEKEFDDTIGYAAHNAMNILLLLSSRKRRARLM
jgi:hypothetical protein